MESQRVQINERIHGMDEIISSKMILQQLEEVKNHQNLTNNQTNLIINQQIDQESNLNQDNELMSYGNEKLNNKESSFKNVQQLLQIDNQVLNEPNLQHQISNEIDEEQQSVNEEISEENQENKKKKATINTVEAQYQKKHKLDYEPYHINETPDKMLDQLKEFIKQDKLSCLRREYDFTPINELNDIKNWERKRKINYYFKEFDLNGNSITEPWLNDDQQFIQQTNDEQQYKITSIDQIWDLIKHNYYIMIEDLEKDFKILFYFKFQKCCYTIGAKAYLTNLYEIYQKQYQKKFAKTLRDYKINDLQRIFQKDKKELKLKVENWPSIPKNYRKFQQISQYEFPYRDYEQIQNKIITNLKPSKCDKNCVCLDFNTMGHFSLQHSSWESLCQNRKMRIECEQCEDHICKNRQISQNNEKKIGEELEDTWCWGIDIYTRKNLVLSLPDIYDEENKLDFIQDKLLKAVNNLNEQGYNMLLACDLIISSKDAQIFNKEDQKKAKMLKKIIQLNVDPEAFQIHTKGRGIICKQKEGIKQNEFIAKYIGEIYPPYRWFEKQDIIKKFLKDEKQNNDLLDFYNIILETHKSDEKGYDIMFVDPIYKGNFASRLSHSCNPNCGTVVTVVDGQYVIGMYALKDIELGQELTFDYCSTTEETKEHQQAICLCGSKMCNGKYLALVKSKVGNQYLEKYYSFLSRNSDVLKASISDKILSQELFEKFNICSNVLSKCPIWVKQWINYNLAFMNKDDQFRNSLIDETKQKMANLQQKQDALEHIINQQQLENKQEDLQLNRKKLQTFKNQILELQNQINVDLCKNLQQNEDRLQNLVITVDKIKHVVTNLQDYSPPVMIVNEKNLLIKLWGTPEKSSQKKSEISLKEEFEQFLYQYDHIECFQEAISLMNNVNKDIHRQFDSIKSTLNLYDHPLSESSYKNALLRIRLFFLKISNLAKNFKSKDKNIIHHMGLSDICYFYAFTHTFFTSTEQTSYIGEPVQIRICDIQNVNKYNNGKYKNYPDGKVIQERSKKYGNQYIWGQTVFWYKQTINNPEASLSQDRRGTLSYPTLNSSFEIPRNTINLQYPFQKSQKVRINYFYEICMLFIQLIQKYKKINEKLIIFQTARQDFFNHLQEKPSVAWPCDKNVNWFFKNSQRLYGTIFFESVFNQEKVPNFLKEIFDVVDKGFDQQIVIFKQMEMKLSDNQAEIIDEILQEMKNYQTNFISQPKKIDRKVDDIDNDKSNARVRKQRFDILSFDIDDSKKKKKYNEDMEETQKSRKIMDNDDILNQKKRKKILTIDDDYGIHNDQIDQEPKIVKKPKVENIQIEQLNEINQTVQQEAKIIKKKKSIQEQNQNMHKYEQNEQLVRKNFKNKQKDINIQAQNDFQQNKNISQQQISIPQQNLNNHQNEVQINKRTLFTLDKFVTNNELQQQKMIFNEQDAILKIDPNYQDNQQLIYFTGMNQIQFEYQNKYFDEMINQQSQL